MGLLTDLLGDGNATSQVLISETALTTVAADVTFTSIPGTYRHLEVHYQAKIDRAVTNAAMDVRFNGDSGTNYRWQLLRSTGTTVAASTESGVSSARVGLVTGASVTGTAATGSIIIPNYRGTTFQKVANGDCGVDVGGTPQREMYNAFWTSTAAITQIRLFDAGAGNFIAGSVFSLYGVK